jgi:hypothetical protein
LVTAVTDVVAVAEGSIMAAAIVAAAVAGLMTKSVECSCICSVCSDYNCSD